jgi:hypothetical protein
LAYSRGFDLIEVHPALLSYSSPPFEIAALEAEGLWHGNWRTGDLAVFKKTLRVRELECDEDPEMSEEWRSFTVGKTNVRVKRAPDQHEKLRFEPASGTGDTHLHSVSRRSPIRPNIDLWTSRNLALKITRPECLYEVLFLNGRGIGFADAVDQVAKTNDLDPEGKVALSDIVRLLLDDAN